MQSLAEEFSSRNTRVIGLSVDTVEENEKLARSKGLTFPLLSDTDGAVISAMGLVHEGAHPWRKGEDMARPGVFVADEDGTIRWRDLTDNWRVRVRPEELVEVVEGI